MAVSKVESANWPARLMFATSMVPARAVTQSTPAMMALRYPVPLSPSTLTEWIRAPGAIPTVPIPLSKAAAVPDTWVPCP